MNYDYTILEEKLKQASPEMQRAIASPETAELVKAIGDKHNLKLDQEAILFDQAAYLMLGLTQANDFVRNISKEAQVDERTARAIAQDVNNEIFGKIKEEMRLKQEQAALAAQAEAEDTSEDDEDSEMGEIERQANTKTVNALEQVGGFTIEKQRAAPVSSGSTQKPITPADRSALLSGIEDPEPIKPGDRTEPLVDYLLGTSVAQPAKKEEVATPPTTVPPTPVVAPKKGPDPYREPIDI